MRLLMAVSKDGYVARRKDDDMSWTGPFDKAVFRLLSHVGGELGCGSRTYDLLPHRLKGRNIHRLSQQPVPPQAATPASPLVQNLSWFAETYTGGWLIGGLHIAVNALQMDLVDEAFICQSDRSCFPGDDGELCTLGLLINDRGTDWERTDEIKVGDTTVNVWKRRR